jgi:hypothetical protein
MQGDQLQQLAVRNIERLAALTDGAWQAYEVADKEASIKLNQAAQCVMDADPITARTQLPAVDNGQTAGDLLIRSGKARNTAVWVAGLGILAGGVISAINSDSPEVGLYVMGAGVIAGIAISIDANSKQIQAGRLLRDKGF